MSSISVLMTDPSALFDTERQERRQMLLNQAIQVAGNECATEYDISRVIARDSEFRDDVMRLATRLCRFDVDLGLPAAVMMLGRKRIILLAESQLNQLA